MEKIEAQKILDDPESTTEQRKEAFAIIGENTTADEMDRAVNQYETNRVKEADKSDPIADPANDFDFDFDNEDQYKLTKKEALTQIKTLFQRYRIKLKTIRKRDPEQAENIETSTDIVLDAIRLKELEVFTENGNVKVKQNIKIKSAEGTIDHIIYRQVKGEDTSSLPTGEGVSGVERIDILLGMLNEAVEGISTINQLSPYDLKMSRALGVIFLV